jgi:hypothetical protein
MTKTIVSGSLCALLATTARAAADDQPSAPGIAFVLQPTIALGTSLGSPTTPTSTAAPGIPYASSVFEPSARVGLGFRPVTVLLSASYSTAGAQGKAVDTRVRIMLVAEPVVWRSRDQRTQLYALAGLGGVAVEAPVISDQGFTTASSSGPSFQLGIGGQHAITDNLSLGVEAFAQTDLIGDDPYVASGTYVAFTGTFATGSR